MAVQRAIIYDGIKAVPAWDFENDRGWTPLGGETEKRGVDLYFSRVPWLYRGVLDRANNVANMPFAITRGGSDIIDSQQYKPTKPVEFLADPRRLFSQLEQSLAMTHRAYAFLETNSAGIVKSVKYCSPSSIEEVFDKQTGALVGYKRKFGAQGLSKEVSPNNIIAVYGADYLTEVGPASTSAAKAALTAAGVLYNADRFIAGYFDRGAIKATVLTVDGGNRDEAERLNSWWADVVAGIKNAWSAVVLRMKEVKATVIGEGLESLQNNELTTERRQDIATALGVPESHLWSAAANYATRVEDEKAYLKQTIIPDCELIAEAFNSQLFNAAHKLDGLALEFRSETLEIFQQDAAEQAQAALTFAELFDKFPTFELWEQSLIMHGYELPDKLVLAAKKYYADREKRAEEMRQQAQQTTPAQDEEQAQDEPPQAEPPQADEREIRAVLNAWKRKAELYLKKSGSANCPFETTIIPLALQGAIIGQLEQAKTAKDIQLVFGGAWRGYP